MGVSPPQHTHTLINKGLFFAALQGSSCKMTIAILCRKWERHLSIRSQSRLVCVQKFSKISKSFWGTGGSFFQSSSGYTSKLEVSPSWVTLGTMGGWEERGRFWEDQFVTRTRNKKIKKKTQHFLSYVKNKSVVNEEVLSPWVSSEEPPPSQWSWTTDASWCHPPRSVVEIYRCDRWAMVRTWVRIFILFSGGFFFFLHHFVRHKCIDQSCSTWTTVWKIAKKQQTKERAPCGIFHLKTAYIPFSGDQLQICA